MRSVQSSRTIRLNPEKVAYWYLRLNGFLQIEDFYVHPAGRGGARTDADLLGVRFPHRAERLYDDPDDIMEDDRAGLQLSRDHVDIVIAEVKAGRCALNGPWTDPDRQNVQRVLAAIGCLSPDRISCAADEIYRTGYHEFDAFLRVRLIACGREEDPELRARFPLVPQVTWDNMLGFIFQRFVRYRRQKSQTDHWDSTGLHLKRMATETRIPCEEFVGRAMSAMNVREL